MQILMSADWHLGITLGDYDRRKDIQNAISQIKDIILKEKPDLFVHLGDVFHSNRNLSENINIYVDFCKWLHSIFLPGIFLVGNHDIVEQSHRTHALDINLEGIKVYDDIYNFDQEVRGCPKLLLIPHLSRSRSQTTPEQRLEELAKTVNAGSDKYIVFSHCNINNMALSTQTLLKFNHHVLPNELIESKNVVATFNGHFHSPQNNINDRHNCNIVGTPEVYTMAEKDDEKRVVIYDTVRNECHTIPLKTTRFHEINMDFVDDRNNAEKCYDDICSGNINPYVLPDSVVKLTLKVNETDVEKYSAQKLQDKLKPVVKYLYNPRVTIIRNKTLRIRDLNPIDTPDIAIEKFCRQYKKEHLVTLAKEFIS